ncbi:phosphotransferase family protein [Steroidobacter sp.]|uniref:phosphotransferase family protein n=1 Tax=Steroidobacter sp. TaxID=1978227 RepID=UPI001A3843D1|nr:phosphotransferase family protein [Steroidobacter sp.]MBL8267681.1 phosphotransferase family protein [Steroidobacter sp.]
MSEPLAVELAIFLRAARDELLSVASGEEDPFRPHRTRRLAAALNHLIVRSESDTDVDWAMLKEAASFLRDAGQSFYVACDQQQSTSTRLAGIANACSDLARRSDAPRVDCAQAVERIHDLEAHRRELLREVAAGIAKNDADKLASRQQEIPPLTAEDVEQFLRARFPEKPALRVANFVRPNGVYSKENYAFDLVGWKEQPVAAILRRDRNFEIVPSSASGEFELLNHLHAQGLPVAHCIAAQSDDTLPLRRPCLIMERLPGATLAKVDPKSLEKVNTKAATSEVVLQLAEPLARLHRQNIHQLPISKAPLRLSRRESFLKTLDEYHDRLHRNQREDFPLLEAGFAWLYNNSALIDDTTTLVHSDYDLRNILFDNGRLSAVLDFELAHVGHPAEDLGYLRKDLGKLIPWQDFIDAYLAAGGVRVPDELVLYFQIWAVVFHGVCNITAFSGYRSGVHNDVFLGTVSFVEFERVQERLLELLPSSGSNR